MQLWSPTSSSERPSCVSHLFLFTGSDRGGNRWKDIVDFFPLDLLQIMQDEDMIHLKLEKRKEGGEGEREREREREKGYTPIFMHSTQTLTQL